WQSHGRLAYGSAAALEYRRSAWADPDAPLYPVNRLGQSVRLRLGVRPGQLWLFPSAEVGVVQDQIIGTRQAFHRIGVQGILSGRGQGAVSVAVEHFTGDVASAGPHAGISASLFFSTQLFHGSRLRASLYGIRQLGPSAQLQGGVDATLEQQLPLGHRLALRVRTSRLLSDRTEGETLASLDYVVPLGVPIGRSGQGARVSGLVLDAETGKGVTDVLVQVGGRTVITDGEGRWAVAGLTPATYHVELDHASLGADRIVLGEAPRPVRAEQGKTVRMVFRLVRGARVTGRVHLSRPRTPAGDRAATGGPVEADGMPNLMVELVGEGTVIRRLTDSKGGFEFTDLPPGRWVLSADASALPPHHRLERDSIALVLQPAAVADIELKVIAKMRPVQFVAAAEIAAGPPAAAERRSGAERVPGPPSDTASYRRYRVTAQDRHLRDVARKLLGDPCAWSRLWHANWTEVPDPARLRPGQILRIPAAETREAQTAGCGEKDKDLK
ncbi:MAG TPA: carboxypeptidase-like regulatory domain-containing protein, partial [Gemmatimonadales bacterium]|nr:carboxypeptidase-like regulatory domain-containing protein [Gemmatimonadales bacterium]